ncbi:hypothetical protein HRM2_14780 [Desulforapulum autotrophicum HRM2]|uniref:Uncharacterized protein n=1 Tax=Desulforapulum autotrophicum (strain ATCC 43914 / DSM 3382 / VKM B-1955 / HRM2) TaxID=177437 RepID=C0Q9M3_DESAH|nr:hypothetical protein [Desulforapulum autotrophicum]ACN14587.1 hypothetical protein HRM2_14780 [Desulforapulum autotrophicum HRM2]
MEQYNNRYLNYLEGRRSPDKSRSFLWPVWIWQVLAPGIDSAGLNVFQRTILGLMQVGQTDTSDMAQWLGVDKELILYILATQLVPNGWVDSRGKLTSQGLKRLDDDVQARQDLKSGYVFQDALNGALWSRVVDHLPYVEPSSVSGNGRLLFRQRRDHDRKEEPFIIKYGGSVPKQPNINILREAIQLGNNTIHNQKVRDDLWAGELREYQISEIELIDTEPIPAYVFCWIIFDPVHFWTISDPCAITRSADWMRKNVHSLARKNTGFARYLSSYLGEPDEKETFEQMNTRLETEVEFEVFANYPDVGNVPNLPAYLGALLRRKYKLEELEDGKENFEDCDDVITQAQKVLECCCKWMLAEWPCNPSRINKKWGNEDLFFAFELIFKGILSKNEIKAFSHKTRASEMWKAARQKQDARQSLRALFSTVIFSMEEHPDHPILHCPSLSFVTGIDQLADNRNSVAHASGKFIEKKDALDWAEFSIQWVELIAGSQE